MAKRKSDRPRFELLDVENGRTRRPAGSGDGRTLRTGRGIVAAALLGMAVVAAVAVRGPTPAPAPVVSLPEPWRYLIALDLPTGWSVDSRGIEPGSQFATVTRSTPRHPAGRPCLVEVSPEDRTDLSESLVDPQRVTIGDRQGFTGAFHQAPGSPLKENERVVWEYADHAWATVLCDTADPVSDAVTVARSVAVRPTRLPVPFSLGPLPRDLRPLELTHQQQAAGPDRVIVDLVQRGSDPPGDQTPATVRLVFGRAPDRPAAGREKLSRPIGDHPAWFNPATGSLTIGDGAYVMTLTGRRLGRSDLVELGDALRLAPDLADASAWPDAPEALG